MKWTKKNSLSLVNTKINTFEYVKVLGYEISQYSSEKFNLASILKSYILQRINLLASMQVQSLH